MIKKILIPCLILVLLAGLPTANPNVGVKTYYQNNLKRIAVELQKMDEANSSEQRGIHYLSVRKYFKKIESLLSRIDKEFYLKNYNGAPLPKLEKNVPDLRVIQPKGLQVIDELLAESEVDEVELSKQISLMQKSINQSLVLNTSILFTDELILHGIQQQWIRDYTLGLTGFDTPGSLAGISDAKHSAEGILALLKSSEINNIKELEQALERNIDYLSANTSFKDFDRAAYYKIHWQPTYQLIVDLYGNNIANWNETSHLPQEVNPLATQLFDTSFFNLQAFLDFNKKELNPSTIELGELLFYDARLSGGGKMSCGSCHNPTLAFTDGEKKSKSSQGLGTVQRNAPTLINSIYTKAFFYDLRSPKLSQQFEHVVFSTDEFNTSLVDIFNKLESDSSYQKMFKTSFPEHVQNPVNIYTFKTALAAYVASLTGFDTKWDKYMRGEGDVSSDAINGYNLFMGKAACGTCHFAPTFAGLVPPYYDDSESEVLGVPSGKLYLSLDDDMGRYSTQRPKEMADFYKHSFKTTTARFANQTGPYMHNGVFETMDEVLEFYNNGGGAGHNLEVPYQTLSSDSLHLNSLELSNLKAFIDAIND